MSNEYDFYELKLLDNNILSNINKNIDKFSNEISKYKKILFICGDYPGYGGAATNCENLKLFFKKNHNVFSFYFYFEKNKQIIKDENLWIGNLNLLKELNFKPDLIILKSFIKFNLREKFKCPIYYLIGGIYLNNLDKYFYKLNTKNENDRYINKSVLKQIKNSDKSFANSYHTFQILKKYYNIKTEIFYSSFINHYKKELIKDINFNKRPYKYGLIVSNFNRIIKNIPKSIEFLKDKENVILIGKNSKIYESYGFKCIDLISPKEIIKYYKKIQYIIQDSFYESCSNVKIESLMNGCKIR